MIHFHAFTKLHSQLTQTIQANQLGLTSLRTRKSDSHRPYPAPNSMPPNRELTTPQHRPTAYLYSSDMPCPGSSPVEAEYLGHGLVPSTPLMRIAIREEPVDNHADAGE